MNTFARGAEYAYWTGRLSVALESALDGLPGDAEVARSCLDEFRDWQRQVERATGLWVVDGEER